MEPVITVLVATRNRPDALAALLRSLEVAQGVVFDVVVACQSDPALRGAVAEAAAGVRLLELAPTGLPDARNALLAAATTPRVVFFDDDVVVLPGTLRALVEALDRPYVVGASPRIVERRLRPNARGLRNGPGLDGRVRVNLGGRRAGRLDTLKGAAMAFRVDALRAAGAADRGFAGTAFLEDADWSSRVRGRLVFVPAAVVVHHSAPSGGCRADAQSAERWRFHNTGRFVRRHRPWSAPLVACTFLAVACRRAVSWRSASSVRTLLWAGWCGFRDGG